MSLSFLPLSLFLTILLKEVSHFNYLVAVPPEFTRSTRTNELKKGGNDTEPKNTALKMYAQHTQSI